MLLDGPSASSELCAALLILQEEDAVQLSRTLDQQKAKRQELAEQKEACEQRSREAQEACDSIQQQIQTIVDDHDPTKVRILACHSGVTLTIMIGLL